MATSMFFTKKLSDSSIKSVVKQASSKLIQQGLVPASKSITSKEVIMVGVSYLRYLDFGLEASWDTLKYVMTNSNKLKNTMKEIIKNSDKAKKESYHISFNLAAHGGNNKSKGLAGLCQTRSKRAPMGASLSCITIFDNEERQAMREIEMMHRQMRDEEAQRKMIAAQAMDLRQNTLQDDWNFLLESRDPQHQLQGDLDKLILMSTRQSDDIQYFHEFNMIGSAEINNYLRTGTTVDPYLEDIKQGLFAEYEKMVNYEDYSYRLIRIPESTIQNFKLGDVIKDKGFACSSALIKNTQSWVDDSSIAQFSHPSYKKVILIYSSEIEKKIASSEGLADNIVVRPDTKLKIHKLTELNHKGEVITVISVFPGQGDVTVKDIVTGEIF